MAYGWCKNSVMAPHSGRAQSLSVKRIAATLLSGDNGERGRVGRCAGVQVAGVGRRAGWEALRRAKGTSVAEGLTGVACARTDDAGRGGLGEGSRQVASTRVWDGKSAARCWASAGRGRRRGRGQWPWRRTPLCNWA
jgi:hypothetical protein